MSNALNNTTVSKELEQNGIPDFYMIVNDIAKKKNIGTVIRSAAAFRVKAILCVGRRKNANFFGSQGTTNRVKMIFMDKLSNVREWCTERNVKICGIEIGDKSKSILDRPFTGSTAFILGNEGHGMSQKEMDICDFFTYIPHYGSATASLNVAVAGSIIFQYFAAWAGYNEHDRQGQKFVVIETEKVQFDQDGRPILEQDEIELKNERTMAKQIVESRPDVDLSQGCMFGNVDDNEDEF